jgi:ankyrin repeat protein
MCAAMMGHIEVLRLLLEHGGDASAADNVSLTSSMIDIASSPLSDEEVMSITSNE